MRRVAAVLLVVAAACAGRDGGPPLQLPVDDETALVEADGTPLGFDLVAARVVEADGEVCDLCLWLARSADQRRRGLMHVTDLGPADGMAFVYERPHTAWFWMQDTVLSLSIAFFDADGAYLDAFDMEPCTTPTCTRHATPRNFLIAVETPQGGLAELGIATGSRIELLDRGCGE